jgi:hypothetical protein
VRGQGIIFVSSPGGSIGIKHFDSAVHTPPWDLHVTTPVLLGFTLNMTNASRLTIIIIMKIDAMNINELIPDLFVLIFFTFSYFLSVY